jgi:hypothetical protein
MIISHQKVIRLVVPLLVFSISQVYIQASLSTGETQAQTQIPAAPMVGRLEVHGKKHILVDSNDAESGATILDGQTLETSNCASATVHLLPVGIVSGAVNEFGDIELAANSKAVINYSAGKVKVTLIRGCARVQTSLALDATIDTPDGVAMPAMQRDPDRKRAEVCYPTGNLQDFRPRCIPPIVWVLGAGAAGGTVAAVVAVRGSNPSQPAPVR